jgi:hypothetical protein
LDVQLDQVHTVLRLSVTLEDFATAQSNLHALHGTGWLPPQHTLAPCILLTDLEIVFDILAPAGQKLNYLKRRTELSVGLTTIGDELDHLGFYLGTGFNIGEAEFSNAAIQLIDMSKEIDDFCIARAEGIQIKKPQLRLSKRWSEICAAIEQRAFERWSDAYNILLTVSPDEQERAERLFMKLITKLRAKYKDKSSKDYVVVIPTLRKMNAVSLFAFRDEDTIRRHERMQSIASQAFEHSHVANCLVVAINIDRERGPYSTLAVFFRENSPERGTIDDLVVY